MIPPPPQSPLFPYTTLFRSESQLIVATTVLGGDAGDATDVLAVVKQGERNTGQPIEESTGDCAYGGGETRQADRKSTRLNSSHVAISYAVFCLKKKKT